MFYAGRPEMQQEKPHALNHWIYAQSPSVRIIRTIGISLLVAVGVGIAAGHVNDRVQRRNTFSDLLALYVLSNAVANSANINTPLDELSQMYGREYTLPALPHPSPHPPTASLLFFPFVLAGCGVYTVGYIWLILQFLCLFFSVYTSVLLHGTRLSLLAVLVTTFVLLIWAPVIGDMKSGNVNCIILLLLSCMWLALHKECQILAGVLLGLSLLIKQIAWPVLLLFIIKKKYLPLFSTLSTVIIGYFLIVPLVGMNSIYIYFSKSLPYASSIYGPDSLNLSLWSLGNRIFCGTKMNKSSLYNVVTEPLIGSEFCGRILSLVLPTVVLIVSVIVIGRMKSFDFGMSLMFSLTIVINPIAWHYYFVLLVLPVGRMLFWLSCHRFPRRITRLFLLIIVLMIPDMVALRHAAAFLSGLTVSGNELLRLPFFPSLITITPLFAVCLLMYLVARIGLMER